MSDIKFYESKIPWIIMLIFIILGLIISAYLTVLHIRVYTDSTYAENSSVCSISKGVNCESVAENPYSIFLEVPVSIWGFFGNFLMLLGVIAGIRAKKKVLPAVYMLAFTLFAVLVSFVLGYISFTKINSICIFCFTTYGINAVLLGFSIYLLIKNSTKNILQNIHDLILWFIKNLKLSIPFVVFSILVVGLLIWKYPKYWNIQFKSIPISIKAKTGVDNSGAYWMGNENASFILEEYSDYKCPFCSHYHKKVRAILNKYPTSVKLIHHNFPLDQDCNPLVKKPFHIGSCHRALLAICAGNQGKFWEANDLLFSNRHKRFSAYRLALKLGINTAKMEDCVVSKEAKQHLQKEIQQGIKHRLQGTPAYFLNGKRYRSLLQIEKIIEKSLTISYGKTPEGFHWRGAKNPKITVYEYTDFECPFCRKMFQNIKKILRLYPDKVRFVHIHFPLDQSCNPMLNKPFHKYACKLSKLALCADKQNKFFKSGDYLFSAPASKISAETFAKKLGLNFSKLQKCMNSQEINLELKKNIQAGLNKNLRATPTFIINGKNIPPKNLFKEIQKLLK